MSKYIKLEDVQKLLQSKLVNTDGWTDLTRQNVRYRELLSDINSLPSVNFEEIVNHIDDLHRKQYKDEDSYDEFGKWR